MKIDCLGVCLHKDFFVVANWKMNKNSAETKAYLHELSGLLARCSFRVLKSKRVVLCVPFTSLSVVVEGKELPYLSELCVGAQNCHFSGSGAFTGEISANMLVSSGVDYVILGHSERRILFGETDEFISRKVSACLNCGLKVILCVGEDSSERKSGKTADVIKRQIDSILVQLEENRISDLIVAYEPVWAIGAGISASLAEVNEVAGFIDNILKSYCTLSSKSVPKVIYGGSVSKRNVKDIAHLSGIDGVLVGRASLNCREFVDILSAI